MIKKCPKCGKEFECTADESCWCNKYSLDSKLSGSLNYDDCLCEDCLKEMENK